MKCALTILVTTLLAVALAGPASAQTDLAATNPGATPTTRKNEHQGKPATAANPADKVTQKVADSEIRKLGSAVAKDLKSVKARALKKVGKLRHHRLK